MKKRQIGNTGLWISEIGFGCGGNAGLMVGDRHAKQERIVTHALNVGITYFDNAPDYGDGRAEENLGRILKTLKPRPVINSKVEIRRTDLDDIAGHIDRSVNASLARLGVDALDIVQIHNGPVAERPDLQGETYKTLWIEDYTRPGGAIEGIRRVLEKGTARHAGFISRGDDHTVIPQLLETGLFSLINLPFSLLNPTPGSDLFRGDSFKPDHHGLIERAAAAGTGIAVYSPLAGGLLTDGLLDSGAIHPLARAKDMEALAASGRLDAARRFQAIARKHGMPLTHLAYRFLFTNRSVTTVLGGFSTPEHLDDVACASDAGPLSRDVLDQIQDVWRALAQAA